VDGYECVRQATLLAGELHRLLRIRDAHRELIQLDNTLTAHVKDMEDFEESSKQDRARVLKGNSTALLAEEKYRRNGKKKYEVITDKILAAGEALQILLAAGGNGSGSGSNSPNTPASSTGDGACVHTDHLLISIDLSEISARGNDFLSGKKVFNRDFSELMHLHTTNIGAGRRWSGQNDAGSENDKENSPGVNLPSNAALQNPLLPPQPPDSDDMPDLKAAGNKASKKGGSSTKSAATGLPRPTPSSTLRSTRKSGNAFKSEYVSGH
jgi:hypothetical protein